MRERTTYIDEQGEIRYKSEKSFTDSMNEEGYRVPSHKLGARLFSEVEFPQEMTDAELGKMTRLSKLMIAKTNMLGYRKNNRIEAYTASEIGEIAGFNGWRGKKFVNKMTRLRVIQRVGTNSGPQYYINPAYFMANGQRLNMDLFLLFRDDLTSLLPAWAISEFLKQAREKPILKSDAIEEVEKSIAKGERT